MRTALYRLYDENDALLYVGLSGDPRQRWNEHATMKRWWPSVVRKSVEWFDDQITAARAEAAAIRTENPSKNAALPDEDGLGGWTPIPGRRADERNTKVKFRIDDELWDAFGEAIERASPEDDRSAVIRQLIRWYASVPGAKLPERPEPKENIDA